MSGVTTEDFIAYWRTEGENYTRAGDYDWMASLVPGRRILEIGCGAGFGTAALLRRKLAVLALDNLPECLEATRQRVAGLETPVGFLAADIAAPDEAALAAMAAFAPDTVVCWLMGAPSEATGATRTDAGQAVAAYREQAQRAVAELAARLETVRALHYVDRTVIPWQAKDLGRDTLVRYHLGKTLLNLPFQADRGHALYRKLEGAALDLAEIKRTHPALKSATPTLASLVAERKS